MNIANKKITALCILACGGLFSASSSALTIDITGTVVASPCTVNGGDNTLDISLGDNIQADELATPGNTTNWKNFSLNLTNCPPPLPLSASPLPALPTVTMPVFMPTPVRLRT